MDNGHVPPTTSPESTNPLSSTCFITHPNDNGLPPQVGLQLRVRCSEESTALQSQKGMSVLVTTAQLQTEAAISHTSETAEIPVDTFPYLVVHGLGVLGL